MFVVFQSMPVNIGSVFMQSHFIGHFIISSCIYMLSRHFCNKLQLKLAFLSCDRLYYALSDFLNEIQNICFRNRDREREKCFINHTLNTFYLRLYGVRHMVKDHSNSEKGNPSAMFSTGGEMYSLNLPLNRLRAISQRVGDGGLTGRVTVLGGNGDDAFLFWATCPTGTTMVTGGSSGAVGGRLFQISTTAG